MSEQPKIDSTTPDKRSTREKHFDDVYAVFFAFYQEKLRGTPAPHERVRLLLTTSFFDDVALQKAVHPVFSTYTTTVAEKQAIARMAFYDALTIHNATAGMKFVTVSNADIATGKVKL